MYSFFSVFPEETDITRESARNQDDHIGNPTNRGSKDRAENRRLDSSNADWLDHRQDMLIRERAYRSLLVELKAELREQIVDGTADVKLLKDLSSKNGVSLTWYFLRIAVPVLDGDLKQ